ncbi:MAG: DUF4465 domain-containing protein [Bacteroidales bacterium]|jgi:hypothetical protein|nr:DUF4465 domain-containing protein [Bacteroidales bacterium]
MKKINLFYVIAIAAVLLASCKPESETKTYIVDFEDVTLTDGIYNGSDLSGTPQKETAWGEEITNYYKDIVSGVAKFQNVYTNEWMSWKGFSISSKTDKETVGWGNQYSVYASGGALGSKQFAVAFSEATATIEKNEYGNFKINSLMLNNSTYAYLGMKNGEYGGGGAKKFEANDWFKVIITGSLNRTETAKVEYYLADFRDGKTFILDKWTKVDVSALGEVDKLTFEFASSDTGEWGMNTPAYVCVDNIEFEQTIEN